MKFANWDKENVDANAKLYKKVQSYKNEAQKLAEDLADFERNDVILMLDKSIADIKKLIAGETFRKESANVDWTKVTVDKDQLTYNNRPVFLADYSWKPDTKELNEYHGNQDGFFLTPSFVVKEDGSINSKKMKELDAKSNGSLGFIFMNHKGGPEWSKEKFGPNFSMREDTYTAYDIDIQEQDIFKTKYLMELLVCDISLI